MDIYEEIVRLHREGQQAVVATIVRRLGSTPRKDNAKMLIYPDGSSFGSVGGGCVEAQVWQEAREIAEGGQARLLKYQLTEKDAEEEGLICGGTVEIFVEPIRPNPKIILMGAGHLGQAIAEAGHRLGAQIAVLDDRETFANRDRFPQTQEIVVDSFDKSLEQTKVTSNSYILIITRGHNHDQVALEKAIQTKARYIGLVGSRRKIHLIVESLLKKGYSPELFRNLYAPIGVEIGSETPEEIAISVLAELIAIQKGIHRRSEKQRFVVKLIEQAKMELSPEREVTAT